MRRVMGLIQVVSQSDAPVLVTGESGTGKELVARMLHERSSRAGNPFVAVNCGALSETLIEAELFGHERGAFTGAVKRRDGRFKAAHGGTLFLDEVAELPLSAQAKLLRVLQEGTFEPLGTNTTVKVDVRIISATHRDLQEADRRGRCSARTSTTGSTSSRSRCPPLRERPGDLPLLLQHFLQRFVPAGRPLPTVSPGAWAALSQHPFPGNVRELSHAIEHAVVLSARRRDPARAPARAASPPAAGRARRRAGHRRGRGAAAADGGQGVRARVPAARDRPGGRPPPRAPRRCWASPARACGRSCACTGSPTPEIEASRDRARGA